MNVDNIENPRFAAVNNEQVLSSLIYSPSFRQLAAEYNVRANDFIIADAYGDSCHVEIAKYILSRPTDFKLADLTAYLLQTENLEPLQRAGVPMLLESLRGKTPIPEKTAPEILKQWLLAQRMASLRQNLSEEPNPAKQITEYVKLQKQVDALGSTCQLRKSNLTNFIVRNIKTEPAIIEDVIKRSTLNCLTGPSKAYKSWHLIRLALCVAHGLSWFGKACTKSKTLLINTELLDAEFEERIQLVARELGLEHIDTTHFVTIHTLGISSSATSLYEAIKTEIVVGNYGFVCFDSIYRLYGMIEGLEENSNDSMLKLCVPFEELAQDRKLAIVIVQHSSKGDQSGKRAIDVAAGGGMHRVVRAMITIRILDEDKNRFLIDITGSYYRKVSPICIICEGPTATVDTSYTREELSATCKYSNEELLACFTEKPENGAIIFKRAKEQVGISKDAFYTRLKSLKLLPQIQEVAGGLFCLAKTK